MLTKNKLFALAMALVAVASQAQAVVSAVDPAEILRSSDQARGGGIPGVAWVVDVVPGDASDTPQTLAIKANGTSSLAETLEPSRFKGAKLLQVNRNMWMSRPGLRKPIPISPRQKLSGQAAQGDIASTNYAVDYTAKLRGEEVVNGEPTYVLELSAVNQLCTYDRIVYWVSQGRRVGVKAEFYSLSGKLLKTAEFDYKNSIAYSGKNLPFVSQMVIKDALTSERTTLRYTKVRAAEIPNATFDASRLSE